MSNLLKLVAFVAIGFSVVKINDYRRLHLIKAEVAYKFEGSGGIVTNVWMQCESINPSPSDPDQTQIYYFGLQSIEDGLITSAAVTGAPEGTVCYFSVLGGTGNPAARSAPIPASKSYISSLSLNGIEPYRGDFLICELERQIERQIERRQSRRWQDRR